MKPENLAAVDQSGKKPDGRSRLSWRRVRQAAVDRDGCAWGGRLAGGKNITAFATKDESEAYHEKHGGRVVTFNQALQDVRRQ